MQLDDATEVSRHLTRVRLAAAKLQSQLQSLEYEQVDEILSEVDFHIHSARRFVLDCQIAVTQLRNRAFREFNKRAPRAVRTIDELLF